MDTTCPNCGATNRPTSRFCAKCGQPLPRLQQAQPRPPAPGQPGPEQAPSSTPTPASTPATATPQEEGKAGFDLPWLQTVQERASRPPTERLIEQEAAPPIPQASAQAAPPTTPPTPVQDHAMPAEPAGVGAPPPAPTGSQATPLPADKGTDTATGKGAPDEAPPDWVVGILEPSAASPEPPDQAYEPEELAHIMPWVHGAPEEQAHAREKPATVPGHGEESVQGLPPWLRDLTGREGAEAAAPESHPVLPSTSAQPPELNIEDIEGIDIEPFVPPDIEPPAAQGPTPARKPVEQVPEWLKSIAPIARQEVAAPEVEPTTTSGQPAPTRPGTALPPSLPAQPPEPIEEPVIRNIPVRAPRPGALDTLAALLAQAPEATRRTVITEGLFLPAMVAETRARRGGLLRWLLPDGLIYLLVLLALIVVLAVGPSSGELTPPPDQGVQQFLDAIEEVPANRPVLLAYDWDATRSAEMSILSKAVMHHLMSRRLRFVTVSTSPQGPGFAQQIADSVAADPRANYGYQYGREYLVLGYLPGNEAALKALVNDFSSALPLDYERHQRVESFPLLQGIQMRNLGDFALIIALSSDETELRNWIEQVAARTGVPVIAAVPQSLDPMARTYTGVPGAGLKAVISGPTGALYYTRQLELRGRIPAAVTADSIALAGRLNAQSVAQLLVSVVIIVAIGGLLAKTILRR